MSKRKRQAEKTKKSQGTIESVDKNLVDPVYSKEQVAGNKEIAKPNFIPPKIVVEIPKEDKSEEIELAKKTIFLTRLGLSLMLFW